MAEKPEDMYAPTMEKSGQHGSILIIAADNVHDLELFYPYYRLVEEGYKVDVASPSGGEIKGKAGWPCQDTLKIQDVNPKQYAMLIIPGGKAPAELRELPEVTALANTFFESGKPIAAFCHGPQVLIDAGLAKGRNLAAWPEVEKEIEEAGGNFINQALVQDGQFITARWPGDLPGFTAAILRQLRGAETRQQRKAG